MGRRRRRMGRRRRRRVGRRWRASGRGREGGGRRRRRMGRRRSDVCGRSMPLMKAGVFRVHGPLSNRCRGSGMSPSSPTAEDSLPVSAAFNASTQCSPLSVPVPVSNFMIANNSSAPTTVSADEAELFLSTIRDSSRARILKRIPRTSRHLAATKLASILDDVTEKNDFPS